MDRRAAMIVLTMALLASATVCSENSIERSDGARLTIEIISPTRESTLVTDTAHVSFGGKVGGWTVLDPAPDIHWANQATGASGVVGQNSGTWAVNGGVDLQPGDNRLTARASNDTLEDASDSVVVTYQP
jgi:hypothetical protein